MYINNKHPAMIEVIKKLRTVSRYDYDGIDDFLDNGIDDELGDRLRWEIECADQDTLKEFLDKLPWSE